MRSPEHDSRRCVLPQYSVIFITDSGTDVDVYCMCHLCTNYGNQWNNCTYSAQLQLHYAMVTAKLSHTFVSSRQGPLSRVAVHQDSDSPYVE